MHLINIADTQTYFIPRLPVYIRVIEIIKDSLTQFSNLACDIMKNLQCSFRFFPDVHIVEDKVRPH